MTTPRRPAPVFPAGPGRSDELDDAPARIAPRRAGAQDDLDDAPARLAAAGRAGAQRRIDVAHGADAVRRAGETVPTRPARLPSFSAGPGAEGRNLAMPPMARPGARARPHAKRSSSSANAHDRAPNEGGAAIVVAHAGTRLRHPHRRADRFAAWRARASRGSIGAARRPGRPPRCPPCTVRRTTPRRTCRPRRLVVPCTPKHWVPPRRTPVVRGHLERAALLARGTITDLPDEPRTDDPRATRARPVTRSRGPRSARGRAATPATCARERSAGRRRVATSRSPSARHARRRHSSRPHRSPRARGSTASTLAARTRAPSTSTRAGGRSTSRMPATGSRDPPAATCPV